MGESIARPRVLVLSRSYPNNVTELLGLWVQSQVRVTAIRQYRNGVPAEIPNVTGAPVPDAPGRSGE